MMDIQCSSLILKGIHLMKKLSQNFLITLSAGVMLLSILACSILTPRPIPTTAPPTPTATPGLLSQQVTLISQPFKETNQTPPFTITSQIPQLTGSDDPRLTAFN